MSDRDPNEFLMGGGSPTAKFDTVGEVHKGTVVDFAVSQQRDFASGEPKFYGDGNAMMQLVITLQTDERDGEIAEDDGKRRVFAKGQMLTAIRSAVKAVNGRLEEGATLAVQFTGTEPSTKGNPKKLYTAQYKPAPTLVDAGGVSAGAVASDLI